MTVVGRACRADYVRTRVGAQMLLERVRVLESGTCCLELARSASNCRTA